MKVTLNLPDNAWVPSLAMCLQQADGNTFIQGSFKPKDGMTISSSGNRDACFVEQMPKTVMQKEEPNE